MGIVEVHMLRKTFGNFIAVDDISFSLGEGEILGLLGPNGAGKTTTIQMLLGVLEPTGGEIRVFGKPFARHRDEILERMNFSSTYTNLPWSLSVCENLTYTAWLYDITDRKTRVEEIIAAFRLEPVRNQIVSELSAGQVTRVNLAKAFLNDPRILLLDEPTASLDPEIASYIRQYILERRHTHKLSILFTSHNMPEVEEVCDRVMFINKGKIVADDTPERLARSLDFCRVRLMVLERARELKALANELGVSITTEDNYHTIEMNESRLPSFLQRVTAAGIPFLEISIEKPTLEDYFFHVAGGTNTEHFL